MYIAFILLVTPRPQRRGQKRSTESSFAIFLPNLILRAQPKKETDAKIFLVKTSQNDFSCSILTTPVLAPYKAEKTFCHSLFRKKNHEIL